MAKAKTVQTPLKGEYISNPYRVTVESFKAMINVNRSTLLAYAGVGLLSAVATGLFAIVFMQGLEDQRSVYLLSIIPLALLITWGIVLLAGFTRYSLATARGQEVVFDQTVKYAYRRTAKFTGLLITMGAIILGGLLAFIIPGILFIYWFALVPYVFLDKDMGIRDSLRRSRELVRKQRGEVLGLFGVGLLLSLPGNIPLVGFLYTIVLNIVTYIAWAYRYTSMDELDAKGKKKPATDPSNYWLFWVGVVLFVVMGVVFTSIAKP